MKELNLMLIYKKILSLVFLAFLSFSPTQAQSLEGKTQSFKEYQILAKQRDAETQFNLGVMHATGKGAKKNNSEAVKWFKQAVLRGHAKAQLQLGLMYYKGEGGLRQNYNLAIALFKKSAEQGISQAQFNLGMIYYKGEGVAKNYEQAVFWLEKAADQGNAQAQYNLATMYYTINKNERKALRLYKKRLSKEMYKLNLF